MTHTQFIKILCEIFKPNSYLELGVSTGVTFLEIEKEVTKSIAVDIKKLFEPKKGKFFHGTTDNFFLQNKEKFDTIFIDANHDFDFVKRDFENSMTVLGKNGIIIFHDTDPEKISLLSRGLCSDCYKIIDYINLKYSNTVDIFTFPIGKEGVTIIKWKDNRRCLQFI